VGSAFRRIHGSGFRKHTFSFGEHHARVIWDSAECGAAFADESSAVLDASVPAEVLLFDLA
jgi:hypothetical protein